MKEERRLRVFENRVLKRIYGPKRDRVLVGKWRWRELCGRRARRREMNVMAKSVDLGSWLTTGTGMASCAHCIL